MDDEILTLDEVAAYLKVAKRTLYRLAQEGQLPAFKVGGSWRFKRDAIDTWIREQMAAQSDVSAANKGDA